MTVILDARRFDSPIYIVGDVRNLKAKIYWMIFTG